MTFSDLAIQAMVKNAFQKIEDNPLIFFHDPLVLDKPTQNQKTETQDIQKDTLQSMDVDYD
jgi:hypothetical protein